MGLKNPENGSLVRRLNSLLFKWLIIILLLLCLIIGGSKPLLAASPLDVVINEVAWMGTEASTADEWIELKNNTDHDIDLTNWILSWRDGAVTITLSGIIPANGYYLLEKTDDHAVDDISADLIYHIGTYGLRDTGEKLELKDADGIVIDTANGDGGAWPAGDNTTKSTMERIDPLAPDRDDNWCTNDGVHRNGLDAAMPPNPINGTPKARNSCTNQPPVANAGSDQTVNVGNTAQLDGSSSSDPDGDPLSYNWSFISRPAGSAAVLSDPNIVDPTFIADVAGDYVLELTVDDGRGGTDSDQVTITAVTPVRKGDANGDGKIDMQDAILAAKFALGLFTPNEYQRKAANVVSPCGVIDARDVVRIAEVALEIKDESVFTCNGGSGEGMGIVTLSSTQRSRTIQLRITSKEIISGERVTINISASAALEGIQAGPQGSLSFDPEIIQVKAIKGVPPFQVLASEIDNEAGKAKFMAIATGELRSGEIIEIEVEAVGQVGESTVIKLTPDMALDAEGNQVKAEVAKGRISLGQAMPLRVYSAMNIPNPARGTAVTRFIVKGQGIKDISLKIFDLSGRKVFASGWVENGFEWHLQNDNGEVLANGVYLYVITIRGFKGEIIRSQVKKLVILR